MFPAGCLMFLLFIFALPFLFVLGFLQVISFGFEKLGLSSEITFLTLFLILIGSLINIPLTKKKKVRVREPSLFGLFERKRFQKEGISINLGGAIIPLSLCAYFALETPVVPMVLATGGMIFVCWKLARIVPGRGIGLPAFIPPIFSALLGLILAPNFAAPIAFISGVLGTLIGADLLNLKKIKKVAPGTLSIGGAGVFDGIFLVGIISAVLAGL